MKATNPAGELTSKPIRIEFVEDRPAFIFSPTNLTLIEGDGLTNNAFAIYSKVPTSFQWFFNGASVGDPVLGTVVSYPARYSAPPPLEGPPLDENYFQTTILIREVRLFHAGPVVVVASNAFGMITSQVATLSVKPDTTAGTTDLDFNPNGLLTH